MSRKIVFAHGRAPGDVLMLSAGIRDFKGLFPDIAVNIETKFDELFDNNPRIDRSVKKGDPGVEYYRVGYPVIQGSNEGNTHFTKAFLLNMVSQVDAAESLPISLGEFCSTFGGGRTADEEKDQDDKLSGKFKEWREKWKNMTKEYFKQWGDIHLSDAEKQSNPLLESYGVDKYWIIAPGGKRDCTCKIWDWRKFQKVIDYFDGILKFVVIGRSDHLIEPMRGVISFVDKTPKNLRPLIPLFYHAEGVVSGVSFPMHLAAAMPTKQPIPSRKPCVAIYGGREPVSFTGYCNHQILHTNGALSCCADGGCWQSRISPITKDADKNNRLCHNVVDRDDRQIQKCMDMISSDDVIRAILKYYDGGRYELNIQKPKPESIELPVLSKKEKKVREINILASLQSSGGGEQSALEIARILQVAGWKVNFHPWDKVCKNYSQEPMKASLMSGKMAEEMTADIPLLFYANDQIWKFCDEKITGEIVKKSSSIAIGINYCNGSLPKCSWLARSGKLRGVVFQNKEKLSEFRKSAIGMENIKLVSLFGAIKLDKMYAVPQLRHVVAGEPLVILKHCKADYRKYVTAESEGNGEKIHVWQKKFSKESDVKFYSRLIADCKFPIRFEFMEAHSELVSAFAGDDHFKFHPWDSMPVTEFLGRGHLYLYRSSNLWRDQYPRCVAEALAAGLPVLSEPRDGTADRIVHGDTGFYCCDYDAYVYAIKAFNRKEDMRFAMGYEAKEWAKKNLDPRQWIDVLENLVYSGRG